MPRLLVLALIGAALFAQQKPQQKPSAQQMENLPPPIRVSVEEVVAPVLVFDQEGNYVNGLQPDQFRLFDNDKEQNIHVDVAYNPISLVIAIQANEHVQGLLPQVNRIGNLVAPLLIGNQGEAAVVAYDARIRTLQDFTSDPDKITQAIKKIYPGSTSNRMVDAVVQGTRMLNTRPANRRRILLLIGETRDMGSENRVREALINLQLANVIFYSVDMSRFITTLTAPPPVPRPNTNPPASVPLPSIVAATPNMVENTYGLDDRSANFLPLLLEIYRDAKAVFKANPVELFTKGTGGSEFGFHSQRTLEDAMQRIGDELHSQYLISYVPNDKEEGGFHHITVEITGAPQVKRVQTRPGYWLAAKFEPK